MLINIHRIFNKLFSLSRESSLSKFIYKSYYDKQIYKVMCNKLKRITRILIDYVEMIEIAILFQIKNIFQN